MLKSLRYIVGVDIDEHRSRCPAGMFCDDGQAPAGRPLVIGARFGGYDAARTQRRANLLGTQRREDALPAPASSQHRRSRAQRQRLTRQPATRVRPRLPHPHRSARCAMARAPHRRRSTARRTVGWLRARADSWPSAAAASPACQVRQPGPAGCHVPRTKSAAHYARRSPVDSTLARRRRRRSG